MDSLRDLTHVWLGYGECSHCNFILQDNGADACRTDNPCPVCGNTGYLRSWPSGFADDHFLFYFTLKQGKLKNNAILLSMLYSTYDAFSKSLIRSMMMKDNIPENYERFILRCTRHNSGLESFYEHITGAKIRTVLDMVCLRAEYNFWSEMRDIRNDFMHELPPAKELKKYPSLSDLERLESSLFGIFRTLHNYHSRLISYGDTDILPVRSAPVKE